MEKKEGARRLVGEPRPPSAPNSRRRDSPSPRISNIHMFCLSALSAKERRIKSVCAHAGVGRFFSQDVVIWVRPDWNDKPPSCRIVSGRPSAGVAMAFFSPGIATPSQPQTGFLSVLWAFLPLTKASSGSFLLKMRCPLRFFRINTRCGPSERARGEIKHGVEMSLRNQLRVPRKSEHNVA